MASIFEELMGVNSTLTESVRPARRANKSVNEHKKIPVKNLKVESRRIFEETDYDELGQEFAAEPTEENPDEIVLVIDPELDANEDVPENAANDMVGDLVYKCPICGSNYVCDCDAALGEGIEVDENGIPIECPICGDDAEQILVGEIGPAEGAGEETDPEMLDADDVEDEEIPEDEEEESFDEGSEDEEVVEEESLTELFGKKKSTKTYDILTTTNTPKGYKSWYSHKGLSEKEAERVIKELKKEHEGEDISFTKFPHKEESFREGLEDEEVVEDLPAEESALELEIPEETPSATPTADVVVNNSTVTLLLDDTKFESLMTKMIRENYKGNSAFKITKCSVREGKLRLEYFVREGRKVTKGVLVGEGFDKTSRKMTIKFTDKGAFTESFAKTPSFVVECVRIRNAVTPLSLNYDYKVRVNESLYRVSGKVGK